ncbi:MAG: hypothetical protein A2X94_12095 [Bdellovibrionales bacterium GWB1_55_8]|nr:MAG: hypothetical protein A2X94_12095 [Bdellovibrionales bacterium GWB1_55_8]
MDAEIEFLRMYLEDEFRDVSDVRIRIRQPSTTSRSPDLEQDYDPESHDLHKERGIVVQARGREYYFPSGWAKISERSHVYNEVQKIKNALGIS